ncbi:hypothetical protein MATL_G00144680 [Megalops atlanticus]|uniref:Uncharacterized protein n=1 Tax=Megalops atlanticus TaxID=7932 RepID=A0A9D3PV02_MEGAT|nr:hypothetical protein MATL_G00144680 [Megalops atlanticus]
MNRAAAAALALRCWRPLGLAPAGHEATGPRALAGLFCGAFSEHSSEAGLEPADGSQRHGIALTVSASSPQLYAVSYTERRDIHGIIIPRRASYFHPGFCSFPARLKVKNGTLHRGRSGTFCGSDGARAPQAFVIQGF